MKQLLLIFGFLGVFMLQANMASPYEEGTEGSSPFISKYVDILSESIKITIGKEFHQANFDIEYSIFVNETGVEVPLLFYAVHYKDGFTVWVDGIKVEILEVPEIYNSLDSTFLRDFDDIFKPSSWSDVPSTEISTGPGTGQYITISELHYFKANLTPGKHQIKVAYTATPWKDRSGWVNKYSFRYSLSPVSHWKSLDLLTISIDNTNFQEDIKTNLGSDFEEVGTFKTWSFSEVPVEMMEVSYQPKVSEKASILIGLGSKGIALIVSLILVLIHFPLFIKYRRKNPFIKFNKLVWAGAIVIPLIGLVVFLYGFGIIDSAIGIEAGKYHGYTFMVFVFYPFMVIGYGLIAWLIDAMIKRKLNSNL